jgi:hypothetical protein
VSLGFSWFYRHSNIENKFDLLKSASKIFIINGGSDHQVITVGKLTG